MRDDKRTPPEPSPPGPTTKVDWALVRADWEAGNGSGREVAARWGVTEGAVRKHRKAEGWVPGDIPAVKRRMVAEKLLGPGRAHGTQYAADLAHPVRTPEQQAAALNAASDADAEFMRRIAKAAEQSVSNAERLLAEASAALDRAQELDWKETTHTEKVVGDGALYGSSTTHTEKTPGRFDLAFDTGKMTKIATEALQIARKVYAEARGLEDPSQGVNVQVNAQAQANAQAVSGPGIPLSERFVFYRSAAEKALGADTAASVEESASNV